jgi:hypothetical protein
MKRQRASRSSWANTSRSRRLPDHSRKIARLPKGPTLAQVGAAGCNPQAMPPPPLKPVSMLKGSGR